MSRRGTVAGVLAALAVPVGRVAAHGGETTGLHDAPLAVGLFLTGVAVVAASLYADERTDAPRRYVDAGVGVGALAALLGIPAYWL